MERVESPLPYIPTHRLIYRGALILGAFTIVYISNSNDGIEWAKPFAPASEKLHHRSKKVPCSWDYNEDSRVLTPGCVPKICGRYVSDTMISHYETEKLLSLASKGFALDKNKGKNKYMVPATSTFDLLSGLNGVRTIYTEDEIKFIRAMKNKVRETIKMIFGLPTHPYLTHPTFFSRLTAEEPKTINDEYWKLHVDKAKHPSVHYTGVIYLGTYQKDFHGGRFIYGESYHLPYNRTIEPRRGRVSVYTAGSENDHLVERVKIGYRIALVLSFTCNESAAVAEISPDFMYFAIA